MREHLVDVSLEAGTGCCASLSRFLFAVTVFARYTSLLVCAAPGTELGLARARRAPASCAPFVSPRCFSHRCTLLLIAPGPLTGEGGCRGVGGERQPRDAFLGSERFARC